MQTKYRSWIALAVSAPTEINIQEDKSLPESVSSTSDGPTAVTRVGDTAWVLEDKLTYMQDPKLKDQNPGPFKVYAVPFHGR